MRLQHNAREFETITADTLSRMQDAKCPCCGDTFSEAERPDLAPKCHLGTMYVSHWGRFLFLECGTCGRPVGKIAIEQL